MHPTDPVNRTVVELRHLLSPSSVTYLGAAVLFVMFGAYLAVFSAV